jgi:hypothetical protein
MKSLAVKTLTIAACLGVFGATLPQFFAPPSAIAQSTEPSLKDWNFNVQRVRYERQTLNTSEYGYVEASGNWIMVNISVQNRSGKVQSDSDLSASLSSSSLIDSKGQVYSSSYNLSDSRGRDGTPFNRGETRFYSLLFDVPPGTRAKQIVFVSSDGIPVLIRL